MSSYNSDFEYLNKKASDYNWIITHIENGDSGETDTFLSMDSIQAESYDGTKRKLYGTKYNTMPSLEITVIKGMKNNNNKVIPSDTPEFTVQEIRQALKWLTGAQSDSWINLTMNNESNFSSWQPNVLYEKGDEVLYNGSVYRAKHDIAEVVNNVGSNTSGTYYLRTNGLSGFNYEQLSLPDDYKIDYIPASVNSSTNGTYYTVGDDGEYTAVTLPGNYAAIKYTPVNIGENEKGLYYLLQNNTYVPVTLPNDYQYISQNVTATSTGTYYVTNDDNTKYIPVELPGDYVKSKYVKATVDNNTTGIYYIIDRVGNTHDYVQLSLPADYEKSRYRQIEINRDTIGEYYINNDGLYTKITLPDNYNAIKYKLATVDSSTSGVYYIVKNSQYTKVKLPRDYVEDIEYYGDANPICYELKSHVDYYTLQDIVYYRRKTSDTYYKASDIMYYQIKPKVYCIGGTSTFPTSDFELVYEDDNSSCRFLGHVQDVKQFKQDARTIGLTIIFESASPWAYSPAITITKTVTGTETITINNLTDELYKYIYPKVTFNNTAAGSLIIQNSVTQDTTRVNNLNVEKIVIDNNMMIYAVNNNNNVITTRTFGNNFNFVFPRLAPGTQNWTITGNGTITIEYYYPIKIGNVAIDII